MLKNPKKIAVQGVGFTPIALAVHGLLDEIQELAYPRLYKFIPIIKKPPKTSAATDEILILSGPAFSI